ncbi:MAG: hypothetical protein ACKVQW_12565 [Pyrinomonadaceae bacterium]
MKSNRFSVLNILLEIIAILGLVIQIGVLVIAWRPLPEYFPVHFDFSGQNDFEGSKLDLLMLLGLSAVSYVGLTSLSFFPEKFNYPWPIQPEDSERQYSLARGFVQLIKAESIWIFCLIQYSIIGIGMGNMERLPKIFIPSIILAVSTTIIGYFLLATRNNQRAKF